MGEESESTGAAAERAYQGVMQLVLDGEAAEGSWLREQSLAEFLGVSRTPVRQALNRLAAEGVVDLVPNRGAQVTSFSEEDAEALFNLRARVEPLAVRLAVPRLTAERLDELADLASRMESLLAQDPFKPHEMSRLNNEFHAVFLEEAGNRHLTIAMQAVVRPVFVTRTFQRYNTASLQRSMQHHAELIQAARLGDEDWAEAIMRAHILAARHAGHEMEPPA